MSLTQALDTALSGLIVTQADLSVVSGNIANANTPGYVHRTLDQVETAAGGDIGSGVEAKGINRDLNSLLQGQLWSETSGGSYADTKSQLYQQLQQVYGTPGSAGAFDEAYNNFATALQSLSTSPASYSAQTGVLSAAQQLAQGLNSMTGSIQALRSQAEQGISNGIEQANQAMQTIAELNQNISSASPQDAATATLEDQRDLAVTQLSRLMNITVTKSSNDRISISTNSGLQLVGAQASKLQFDDRGSLTANSLWSPNPAKDGAGGITLVAPDGSTADLTANSSIQSGQIGAYLEMRDHILPQAQSQID
jgi:flagellar hook-associated protein 1